MALNNLQWLICHKTKENLPKKGTLSLNASRNKKSSKLHQLNLHQYGGRNPHLGVPTGQIPSALSHHPSLSSFYQEWYLKWHVSFLCSNNTDVSIFRSPKEMIAYESVLTSFLIPNVSCSSK